MPAKALGPWGTMGAVCIMLFFVMLLSGRFKGWFEESESGEDLVASAKHELALTGQLLNKIRQDSKIYDGLSILRNEVHSDINHYSRGTRRHLRQSLEKLREARKYIQDSLPSQPQLLRTNQKPKEKTQKRRVSSRSDSRRADTGKTIDEVVLEDSGLEELDSKVGD